MNTERSERRLEKERRKRAIIRTSTTKLITKLEGELYREEINYDIIEESLVQLIEKENTLSILDSGIEDLIVDDEQFESEISSREDYRDNIILWKTRAKKCLKNINSKNQEYANIAERSENARSPQVNVKLPRLIIEKFSGDVCRWPSFWAQFKTAIHENESLADVDKFNYLKSYLSNAAATAIFGLPLTNENYIKAIKILEDRFGKKDILINAHMNKLLNLTPVKRSYDLPALRKLHDECEIQLRSLETLGIEADSYGRLLCPILFKAIPNDLALEFNKERDLNVDLQVTELLKFVRKDIESRESTLMMTKGPDSESPTLKIGENQALNNKYRNNYDYNTSQRRNLKPASAAALNATVEENCLFCKNSEHDTDNCSQFDLVQKKEILKKNGRCFICLKRNHLARQCRSSIRCAVCQKRHSKALCEKTYDFRNVSEEETIVSSVAPITGVDNISKPTVLLQTVRAIASGSKIESKVRCLLDGGSQRTFIREDLSRQLKLAVTGEEVLKLCTFGAAHANDTKRRRVKLKLCNPINRNEIIEIEALESPEICSAFIEIPSEELYTHLETLNIKLSDFPEKENQCRQIDILIGADYYWKIVSGKMKRLSPSMMLMETLLGWSVQGPLANSLLIEETSPVGVLNAIVRNEQSDDQLISTQLKSLLGIRILRYHK